MNNMAMNIKLPNARQMWAARRPPRLRCTASRLCTRYRWTSSSQFQVHMASATPPPFSLDDADSEVDSVRHILDRTVWTISPAISNADLQSAYRSSQLDLQKMQRCVKRLMNMLEQANQELEEARQPKGRGKVRRTGVDADISHAGAAFCVMGELWLHDKDLISSPRPAGVDYMNPNRYDYPEHHPARAAAITAEIYDSLKPPLRVLLADVDRQKSFINSYWKSYGTERNNSAHRTRDCAPCLFPQLPGSIWQAREHNDTVAELRALITDPASGRYDCTSPIAFQDGKFGVPKYIFRNELPRRLLRGLVHGKAAIGAKAGQVNDSKAARWGITSMVYLCSHDTSFSHVGAKTGIDYGNYFECYKKVVLQMNSESRASLFAWYNLYIWGKAAGSESTAPGETHVEALPDGAEINSLEALVMQLNVSSSNPHDDHELSDNLDEDLSSAPPSPSRPTGEVVASAEDPTAAVEEPRVAQPVVEQVPIPPATESGSVPEERRRTTRRRAGVDMDNDMDTPAAPVDAPVAARGRGGKRGRGRGRASKA
ncbi:hypothetical protein DENSPDRAFT_884683 [Dentipellis sp. KUC8613]|nr:hypothetical protein DENSPDRAFT_884683 [Dentipellis sp. KUC8613]